MANKVTLTPPLPNPVVLSTISNVQDYLISLVLALATELQNHALRLNAAAMGDGSEAVTGPLVLKVYLKAALPSVSLYKDGLINVSDEAGGYVTAFSDGINWRRVTDRAVVS